MTIKQILSTYFPKLKHKSLSPFLDIEILLAHALNKPKEYLYKYPEKKLSAKQISIFKKLFARRLKGEPIAYILGYKEFYGLKFRVDKNVLIPRPETEILVDEVITFVKAQGSGLRAQGNIIDIGTGSGCIIISLAKNIKGGKFYATEISPKALSIAKQNAKLNKVKINFLKVNLFEPIPNSQFPIPNFIIVANLPYLNTKEIKNSTLKYEPKLTLDGGQDGLKYFYELFDQIKKFNLKPQAFFLEIGYNQANKIEQMAKKVLSDYKIKIIKDLCGHNRVIKITTK